MTATLPSKLGTPGAVDLPEIHWTPDERREKLARGIEDLVPVALASYISQDWETFGFKTWGDYVESVTGGLKLPRAKRREMALDLRAREMSTRAIGAIVGASEATIRRDLGEATATHDAVDLPKTVVSIDGRKRPATRPTSVPPFDVMKSLNGAIDVVAQPRGTTTPPEPPKAGGHAERETVVIDVPEPEPNPKVKMAANRKKAHAIGKDLGEVAMERFEEEGIDFLDPVAFGKALDGFSNAMLGRHRKVLRNTREPASEPRR